ncbi:MAG: AEC family transporter [Desulfuromonadaceae bacterium]
MSAVIEKIIPIIMVFLFGYFLKNRGVLIKKDGDSLLKVFFNVSVPSLIFLSVSQMNFSLDLLWLPVIAVLIILITFIVSYGCGRILNLDKPSLGTFLVGSLIMNSSFTFPFLIAAKGEESLALASLFDFGNTAMAFTFTYYLACKYGSNSDQLVTMLKKFVCSPPLLSLIAALFINLNHIALPNVIAQFFKILGYMTVPLVMLSLGIYFSPRTCKIGPVFWAIFIRMGVGLLFGLLFTYLFDLEGMTRSVVLIVSSAPSGMTTLVFSSMEELDNELAASIISYSVLAGMIVVPILLQLTAG